MKKTFVVVSDEAIARIMQWPDVGDELVAVEELTDPDAHNQGADMRDDAQGRRAAGATHSASPGTSHRLRSSATVTASAGEDEQHQQAQRFAKRVADRIHVLYGQGHFNDLNIIAAPRFLGLLRKALSSATVQCVSIEISKDLVHAGHDDISKRLVQARSTS